MDMVQDKAQSPTRISKDVRMEQARKRESERNSSSVLATTFSFPNDLKCKHDRKHSSIPVVVQVEKYNKTMRMLLSVHNNTQIVHSQKL